VKFQCMKEEGLMSENTSEQSHTDFSMTPDEYQGLWDANREGGYPANHFAFRQVLNALREERVENRSRTPRLIEVGIGGGAAISIYANAGFDVWGFDNNPDMVKTSKSVMQQLGLPAGQVAWGDIEDSLSLSPFDAQGGFDSLLAMGVLPHVEHEVVALENMRQLVRPGGTVIVECRNKLFSLFTFNRFTLEFIMDDLLAGVTGEVRDAAADFLATRVDTGMPPLPSSGHEAKYHNPLTIDQQFLAAGFKDIKILPFHYHAAMPRFEKPLGEAFRAQSIAMENESSGWRGLFLCSAFVVMARRPKLGV